MNSYLTFFISIVLSFISIYILCQGEIKFYTIINSNYDGLPLYYCIASNEGDDATSNPNNEEHHRCLNGGLPSVKNGLFSECSCPDNFIGLYCENHNSLHPDRRHTFDLFHDPKESLGDVS